MFTLEPLSGSFGARVTRNTQNVHAWSLLWKRLNRIC